MPRGAHKSYDREGERWPELGSIVISPNWARWVLTKLERNFNVTPIKLRFKKAGALWSTGGHGEIDLAPGVPWLTLIHEFAHVWDCQLTKNWKGITRYHCKRHDELVDRAARYVIEMGWPQRDLCDQLGGAGALNFEAASL